VSRDRRRRRRCRRLSSTRCAGGAGTLAAPAVARPRTRARAPARALPPSASSLTLTNLDKEPLAKSKPRFAAISRRLFSFALHTSQQTFLLSFTPHSSAYACARPCTHSSLHPAAHREKVRRVLVHRVLVGIHPGRCREKGGGEARVRQGFPIGRSGLILPRPRAAHWRAQAAAWVRGASRPSVRYTKSSTLADAASALACCRRACRRRPLPARN